MVELSKEKPEGTEEKGTFTQRFGKITYRFKNAWEKASKAKDKSLFKRITIFVAEFFSEAKGLSDEEKKVDDEECSKIGEFVKNADAKVIADSTKQEIFGDRFESLPDEEKQVVDGFFGVGAEAFKDDLEHEEEVEIGRTMDVLTGKESGEYMTHERRLLLAHYGFKYLKRLKLHFQSKGMGIDEIAKQFDLFESAMKKSPVAGGVAGGAVGGAGNFSTLYKLSFNPLDPKNSVFGLLGSLPEGSRDIATSLASADWSKKAEVVQALSKLLPSTRNNPVAMARIADIVSTAKTSKKRPTNREFAEVLFHIEVSDFDHLAKLVHK